MPPAFTFPRTRAAVRRLLRKRHGRALLSWLSAGVALLAAISYRAIFSSAAGWRRRAFAPSPRLEPAPDKVQRPRRSERGQALIEMALVLPLIFVFLLVLVDFGIALDRREVLQHAVREGARRGAVAASISEVKDTTWRQSQGILDNPSQNPFQITVCYKDMNGNGSAGDAGDNVRVMANFTYKFTVGGGELLTAWGVPVPSIAMTPSADMRLENAVSVAPADVCPS